MAKDSKKKNIEKDNAVVEKNTNSNDNTELNKEDVKTATKATKKGSKETIKKAKNKNGFFKDFKAELKKVVWPTSKEVVNSTTAVMVIVLITTLLVFILDFAFEKLNVHGIDKLRSIVSSSVEDNEADNTTEVDVTENVVVNTTLDNATTTTENDTTVE